MTDPREFWEQKILSWEADRYGPGDEASSWLEKLASRASASLRARLQIAERLLVPHVQGKRIVELGCGSGLLAPALIRAGAASYLGLDIASAAIGNARTLLASQPVEERSHIRFEEGDVATTGALPADLVFSLGLFDWLTIAQIEAVFASSGSADYLHAIAERRASLSQYVHRAYVHVSYGHRTQGYVPRYWPVEEIEAAARPHNPKPMQVYRDRRLSFGALLTSLPLPRQ